MTRQYRRQADVDEIGHGMTEQDRAMVATVAQLRLVSAQQLRRLYFSRDSLSDSDSRRVRYQLARLVRTSVLHRLPRRVGGFQAGSAGYVYRLGPIGHRLITATGSRNKAWRPSEGFVRHTLAISKVYTVLDELQADGLIVVLRFEAEPEAWRTFMGGGGEAEHLKPDGYVVLRSHGFEAHWYLEVDRGTESGAALQRKLERYLRYFQTGTEQERLGLFPQIRFLVSTSGTPSLQTDAERVKQIESGPDRWPDTRDMNNQLTQTRKEVINVHKHNRDRSNTEASRGLAPGSSPGHAARPAASSRRHQQHHQCCRHRQRPRPSCAPGC